MNQKPVWTREEFEILVSNSALSDAELVQKLPRRSSGAIGIVRAGIHAFHVGGNISMLSKMMISYLEEKAGSTICPICGETC